MDGDGDFDAADVQAMMNGGKKKMGLNFSRPPKNKKARAERRARAEKKRAQRDAEAREHERSHQEITRMNNETGGTTGAAMNVFEGARHGAGAAFGKADQIFEADVDDDEGAQEDEIMDSLKQFWPTFTILEVLLCLGFWSFNAFRTRNYGLISQNVAIDDSIAFLRYIKDDPNEPLYLDDCKNECNNAYTCVGIGYQAGPFSNEGCYLLSALPTTATPGALCSKDSWGWNIYQKIEWQWMDSLVMKGGLETIWPGYTVLTSHSYCDDSYNLSILWRAWTYQFTHGNIYHVGANCFMLIMLGIPLEGYQGTVVFAVMWTIGVIGGALCWMLFDPYVSSYGASGGCYSLLGMHLADHILNWGDKKWRYATLFLMAIVTGVEVAAYWPTRNDASSTAHTVHIGGIVAGLLIGFIGGRNDHLKIWEYVCLGAGWIIAIVLSIGSVVFWFFYNDHPAIANAWKGYPMSSERPFCWIGFVCIDDFGGPCPLIESSSNLATNSGSYANTQRQCVMCQTRECVEGYYSTYEVTSGGTTTEHYQYCPQDSSRNYCQFWDETPGDSVYGGTGDVLCTRYESRLTPSTGEVQQESCDLDYPPTKSVWQLSDLTMAPTPAPVGSPTYAGLR